MAELGKLTEAEAFALLRKIRDRVDRYDQTVADIQLRLMELIDVLLALEDVGSNPDGE
jgi:hypothetical protein